ncbi:uncharacterized protein LOC130765176 isoform X2 [Actinidia eriantha]|uniref:uncharacterized protein LOC130765176 isoform X2 n=1 Tax=Actinidia eriantha TaxID=165200 RepID=UPI00258D9716|nr:uncharacterized protein LOC130765176 isoform X2 [Actinidia eriantha]
MTRPSPTSSSVAANAIAIVGGGKSTEPAMENFTALVMKLAAAADPTPPLTDSRKALIEKRLRDVFPSFRTPNHPTYAAMIHGAIKELKEPEGSTKESISEFIKKQYDDLPWAHFTLLKSHLQKLCASGEIVVTSDQCYLLADEISNLSSGARSNNPKRELTLKQQGKKIKGRTKCQRKDQNKEEILPGEHREMNCRLNQLQEQNKLVIAEQNLTGEPRHGLVEELHALQAQEQEQQIVLIEEQNQLEGQIPDSDHLEQNQPDVPSPERPPGFNLAIVKETTTTSTNLHSSAKQLEVEQQHEYPYPKEPPELRLVDQEQQPESNSEWPLELVTPQKACKSHAMASTSLTLPTNSESPELCKLQLPNSGITSEIKMASEGEADEDSCTLQPMLEEWRQQWCKSQRQYEFEQWCQSQRQYEYDKLCQSQKQSGYEKLCRSRRQSKYKQPTMETSRLQVLKSVEKLTAMQQQQQGKQQGGKNQAKSRSETIITQDIPTDSNQRLGTPNDPKQLPNVSISERPIHLDLAAMEGSSQTERMKRQARRWCQLMSASKPPTTSIEWLPSSEVQYPEPELPNAVGPPELKQIPGEESAETTETRAKLRGQQKQIKSQPKEMTDSFNMPMDPMQSELGQRPVLLCPERSLKPQHQPPNRENLQELKQTPEEESTKRETLQPKLGIRLKLLLTDPKMKTGSLDSSPTSQQELEQLVVVPSPEKAKEQQVQQAQENPQHWHLRSWHSKPKTDASTTTAKLMPVLDQHKEQKQPDFQDGWRPLEQKSDVTSTVAKSLPSDHQIHHEIKKPAPQGRGRPCKCQIRGRRLEPKPNDTRGENLLSSEKQRQELKRQGRGRPRKLVKGE